MVGELMPVYIKALQTRQFDFNEPDERVPIALSYRLPDMQESIDVATFSNIIMTTGMPKSRKSFFFDCIMASAYTDNLNSTLGFRLDLQGRSILHIDTEQPKATFKKTRRKFVRMSGHQDNLPNYEAFNLRPFTHTERLLQIEYLLEQRVGSVGFLLIDGLVDLCTNENDDESIRHAIATCMRWSDEYNLLLGTVLHTNRGGEFSNGKLGSTMDKKVDISFLVERDAQTKISCVKHKLSRGLHIEDVYFRHNLMGCPEFINNNDKF